MNDNRGKFTYIAIVQQEGEIHCFINGKLYQTNLFTVANADVNNEPLFFGANSPTTNFG